MTVSIPIAGSDTFTVKRLRLRVNDAEVELPAITFTRTRPRHIGALNC